MGHCSGVNGTGRPRTSHETPSLLTLFPHPSSQWTRVVCVCLRMMRADSLAAYCHRTVQIYHLDSRVGGNAPASSWSLC